MSRCSFNKFHLIQPNFMISFPYLKHTIRHFSILDLFSMLWVEFLIQRVKLPVELLIQRVELLIQRVELLVELLIQHVIQKRRCNPKRSHFIAHVLIIA